jgi:hypothetical protein
MAAGVAARLPLTQSGLRLHVVIAMRQSHAMSAGN